MGSLDTQRAGSLITLNAWTVASAVQLWLNLIVGDFRQSMWYRLLWQSGQATRGDAGAVKGTPNCEVCESGRRRMAG